MLVEPAEPGPVRLAAALLREAVRRAEQPERRRVATQDAYRSVKPYRANAKAPRAAFGETMLYGRDR